jgi:glycerol-1-phosphate dehydrogenase [NAD(P)+]
LNLTQFGGVKMKELFDLNVEDMAGGDFDCQCGHTHSIAIKNIFIGKGSINRINELLTEFKGKRVFIVQDVNTYRAAGIIVEKLLNKDFLIKSHTFKDVPLIADERALGRLILEIPKDTAVIVAVGSGTINDLSRFVSYKLNIPYIIIGTAPSMDGYASVVSPLIVAGVKKTYDAVYPYGIVGDIDIMKEAPMYMLQAGFGDVVGKYTALADWHLANIIKGEYFCSTIEKLVNRAIAKCVKAAPKLTARDTETVESITEALILTGLAIGMVGSSRPASGEEHHLSHCWEMVFMNQNRKIKYLHGNNVGVGVGIIIQAYKYLNTLDINNIYETTQYMNFSKNSWTENIKDVFGRTAEDIIEFKEPSISFSREERHKNMESIVASWQGILKIANSYLPEFEEVEALMKSSGAIFSPKDLGIDRELFRKSFIVAKDVRKRYGVLQLLEDLGVLEEAANIITKKYYD